MAPIEIFIVVGSLSMVKCWHASLPAISETQWRAVSTRFGVMSDPEQKLLPRSMKTVASCATPDGVPPMIRGRVSSVAVTRTSSVASAGAPPHAMPDAPRGSERPRTRNATSEPGLRMRRTLCANPAIVKDPCFVAFGARFGRVAKRQRHHHAPPSSSRETRVGRLRTGCARARAATPMRRVRGRAMPREPGHRSLREIRLANDFARGVMRS